MTSINFRLKEAIISIEAFLCLMMVFLLGLLYWTVASGYDVWSAVMLAPSKVFVLLMFLNRLGALVHDALRRDWILLIFSLGAIICLSAIAVNALYMFKGGVVPGKGEAIGEWNMLSSGYLTNTTGITGQVEEIDRLPEGGGKVKLVLDAGESGKADKVEISLGDTVRLSLADSLRLERIDIAPRFLLMDALNNELSSSFVKLNLLPSGKKDFFMLDKVPHRFYLRESLINTGAYDVSIKRGKLVNQIDGLTKDESMPFDGYQIAFPESSSWAMLEYSHYPGNILLIPGVLLMALGTFLSFSKRGRRVK